MNGAMTRTAREVQQEFAEDLGVRRTIIWDLYSAEEKNSLLGKLATLFPDNRIDSDLISAVLELKDERKKEKFIKKEYERIATENAKIEKLRTSILNALWGQRKYCSGDLLMSVIFVLVTEKTSEESLMEYMKATKFSCHPVFRIRKCTADNESNNCCMIFVDDNARVYKNWDDYQQKNTLPKGVMIAPRKGIYSFDEHNKVELSVYYTPSSTAIAQTIRGADTGAGVLGFGAAMVPLAALLMPVAAPVLAVSAGVCAVTGLWSAGRSTFQLVDRGTHEQSIHVLDREARSAWLGVAGGAIGLGASGATYGLVRQAAAGREIPHLAQLAVNGMNVASILTNGLGVGNGIVELILKSSVDGEKISAIDIVQLAASLALFTHSAYNFQYASRIIETTQNGRIQEVRSGLSRKQQRAFDKLYKETVRVKGAVQGKTDVVRSLGKIPDNQYFSDVHRINKDLNTNNVRVMFGPDGTVLLNNEVAMDSTSLRSNVQQSGGTVLQNVGPIPASHTGVGATASANLNTMPFSPNTALRIIELVSKGVMSSRVMSSTDLGNCICNLCEKMGEAALKRLIGITEGFFRQFVGEIERRLGRCLAFEQVLWKAYNIAVSFGTQLTLEIINAHASDIVTKLMEFFEQQIERSETGERIKCKICPGHYSIVNLE